jgi:hypothetical protein
VDRLVEAIATRREVLLARRGHGPDDDLDADDFREEDDALRVLQSAAVAGRSAVRARPGGFTRGWAGGFLSLAEPMVQMVTSFMAGWNGVHQPEPRDRCVALGERTGLYIDDVVPKGCTPGYLPWLIAGPSAGSSDRCCRPRRGRRIGR